VFVFVSLDQRAYNFHERGEWVCFILANTIYQRVEQCDEALVLLV